MLSTLLNRPLVVHDEDAWDNLFTFQKRDDLMIVTVTNGRDTYTANLPYRLVGETLLAGRDFHGRTVTGVPIKIWVGTDYLHMNIGDIAARWGLDGERCSRIWKRVVAPFDK